jgi:hypothetical protein
MSHKARDPAVDIVQSRVQPVPEAPTEGQSRLKAHIDF